MSNVAEILFNAQNGRLVDNVAQRLGLSPEQTEAAVRALIPALAAGLRNAANDPGALEKIIAGVNEPQRYAAFMDADVAHSQDNVDEGREILAQLFGAPDASGKIAQIAARDSGLRPDILGQLLPVLASVVLGGLFKSLSSQGLGPIFEQLVKSGGLGGLLGQLGTGKSGGGGLNDILEQLGRSMGGQQAPQPPARPSGGGGLGGLLGGLLGAMLGRGAAPSPKAAPAPSPLPGGLDPATLQAALEQLKKILHPAPAGSQGGGGGGHDAELDDVLGQVFGPRKG